MTNNEKLEKIKKIAIKNNNLKSILNMLNWDLETEAPAKSINQISKMISFLSGEKYDTYMNEEFKNLLYSIDVTSLNEIDKKIIEIIKKDEFEKIEKIPKDEYQKYSELEVISSNTWAKAKQTNDFELFKNYLSEIIEFNKKFVKYRGWEGHPYNTLLGDYEPDLTVDYCDKFFDKLKAEILPIINDVVSSRKKNLQLEKAKEKLFSQKYDVNKQKELSNYLLNILKFDTEAGVLKESEHPFTNGTGKNNVRITTHYYENDFRSAMYSTIHEIGHALYEQHISDDIDGTPAGGGVSMGIHESQSRIYENMFCRSREFIRFIYNKIDQLFGLSNVDIDEEMLYELVNDVEKSFIRVEADELTYPIHILIRYELEKEIFSNLDEITDVDKLAIKWADLYEKYLGIRPDNYSNGILQDVHWSAGLFGYFPSYALGTANAAQIYESINKITNISQDLENGDFSKIDSFLTDKIHKYGMLKTPDELLQLSTGEKFNSDYYINYLKNKFKVK